jgi:hypothetical protein
MKNKSHRPLVLNKPSEDDIRAYAYHLYEQSGCSPGHDVDNWLEAISCLNANIPSHQSRSRMHHHTSAPGVAAVEGLPVAPLSLDS